MEFLINSEKNTGAPLITKTYGFLVSNAHLKSSKYKETETFSQIFASCPAPEPLENDELEALLAADLKFYHNASASLVSNGHLNSPKYKDETFTQIYASCLAPEPLENNKLEALLAADLNSYYSSISDTMGLDCRESHLVQRHEEREHEHPSRPSFLYCDSPSYSPTPEVVPDAAVFNDPYHSLTKYLMSSKQNKCNGISQFEPLPSLNQSTLDFAFNNHWQLYHNLLLGSPSEDTKKKTLNYFVGLAYLGFIQQYNREFFDARLLYDKNIFKNTPKESEVPGATPVRYLKWIRKAWVFSKLVGPEIYINGEGVFPLSQFFSLAENLETVNLLKKLGYKTKFSGKDWNFKKLVGLKV